MRALVTGAQGFVGRHLAAALADSAPGAVVVGIGRSPRADGTFTHALAGGAPAPVPAGVARALRQGYAYEQVDVLDAARLREVALAARPDVVFHLAAGLRHAASAHVLRTNVLGTAALLEAVARLPEPRPRVVVGSTGGVYGRLDADRLPAREGERCEPVDVYAVSKLAAEQLAHVAARDHDLDVVVTRLFNVCGPGQDGQHVCGRVAAQLVLGASVLRVGNLRATRDFVDVRDVAAALVCIARAGARGATYNVASGTETPVATLLERLVALSGWTGAVHAADDAPRPGDVPRSVGDPARLRALGFAPRHALDDSLRDLLAYYREALASAAA